MDSVIQTTLLALHLVIVIALVGFILLQPSEGGGLGMGGGDGMSSFMTGRAKANFFTRTTAILATGFFLTTLLIGILNGQGRDSASIISAPDATVAPTEVPVDLNDVPAIGDVPAMGEIPAVSEVPAVDEVTAVQELGAAVEPATTDSVATEVPAVTEPAAVSETTETQPN
ncbi:MAG: preprotein translocase subunit SecG [Alphaproteobacteria bacterium]